MREPPHFYHHTSTKLLLSLLFYFIFCFCFFEKENKIKLDVILELPHFDCTLKLIDNILYPGKH